MSKTKKLTDAQKSALERLIVGDAGFYELIRVGAPGPTMSWLVKAGLAHDIGNKTLRITDAGRAALANGRVAVAA